MDGFRDRPALCGWPKQWFPGVIVTGSGLSLLNSEPGLCLSWLARKRKEHQCDGDRQETHHRRQGQSDSDKVLVLILAGAHGHNEHLVGQWRDGRGRQRHDHGNNQPIG